MNITRMRSFQIAPAPSSGRYKTSVNVEDILELVLSDFRVHNGIDLSVKPIASDVKALKKHAYLISDTLNHGRTCLLQEISRVLNTDWANIVSYHVLERLRPSALTYDEACDMVHATYNKGIEYLDRKYLKLTEYVSDFTAYGKKFTIPIACTKLETRDQLIMLPRYGREWFLIKGI
jgi:hypothetical protein